MKNKYGMRSATKTRSAPKKAAKRLRAAAGTPLTGARDRKVRGARKLLGRTKVGGINVTKPPRKAGLKPMSKLGPNKKAKRVAARTAAKKTLKRYNRVYGK